MDKKAMAYEPGVTFNANCVRNISQSSQSPQIDAKKVEEITPPLIRKSRQ